MEGIIHYELLGRNLAVIAERCSHNNFAVWKKQSSKKPGRPHGRILQHDNARPHTASMTKAGIQDLDWEIFPYPHYSSDLAP
jgi:histone-lysine N-methyltransferase SETMAR